MSAPKLVYKPLKKKPVRKDAAFFSAKKKKKASVHTVHAAKSKKRTQNAVKASDTKNEPVTSSILEARKNRIAKIAKAQKQHDTPAQKVEETQKAVSISPALERSSKAKAAQVEDMASQKPKRFDAAKFSDDILKNVKNVIPKDKQEMENNKTSSDKMATAQQNITDTLEQEKHNSGGDISDSVATTPDETGIAVKETAPLPIENAGIAPAMPDAGFAPPLKTAQDTDLSADSRKIDSELANNNVTEQQLQNANEPKFSAGLADKQQSQQNAARTHQQYLAQAVPTVSTTKTGMRSLITGGLAGMYAKRNKQLSAVDKNKELKKQQEEKVRHDVAKELNRIYTETKTRVDTILDDLKKNVDTIFDLALAEANRIFEQNVDERTDTNWLEDIMNDLKGIPTDVETIFKEEQNNFINYLRPVVIRIGQLVEGELTKATTEIEAGRKATQDYWNTQSNETKKIAGDIFQGATDRYTELEAQVEESSESIKQSVTTKFNQAVSKLRETFDRIKEANKSWLERAFDAVVGIIKAIIEMKNLLLNVLAKVADVIGKIIMDPIGFVSNLIDAIVLGFKNFGKNAMEHLKRGFFEWLMGNMPPSVKFPKQWDLRGIFEFVASVLGFTWDNIKLRATKIYGATVVATMETTFEIFMIIKSDGLGGLWEHIKEKISNLKEMAVDAVQNMLVDSVINAGITWVLSLFNPVGAFIKACKLIYDIITWFINNAKKIAALISSIIDSTALIVAGKIGQAAKYVEESIARAIPIGIAFLAGLLSLGNLSEKVQALLNRIRAPIDKAIDWVLGMAGKVVKGLIKAGKAGVKKLMSWLGLKKEFKAVDGKVHSLKIEGTEEKPALIIRSTPSTLDLLITEFKKSDKYKANPSEYKDNIEAAEKTYNKFYNAMMKNKGIKEGQEVNHQAVFDEMAASLIANIKDMFVTAKGNETSNITYEMHTGGGSAGMKADPLIGNKFGQETSSPTGIYKKLFRRKHIDGSNAYYVQGHLLSYKLGGENAHKNLTPLSRDANKDHEAIIERSLKSYYKEKKKLKYIVKPEYGLKGPNALEPGADKVKQQIFEYRQMEADSVPSKLKIEAYYYNKEDRETSIFNSTINNNVNQDEDKYQFKND